MSWRSRGAAALVSAFDNRPPEDPFPTDQTFFTEARLLLLYGVGDDLENRLKFLELPPWSRKTWEGLVKIAETRLTLYETVLEPWRIELLRLARLLATGRHLLVQKDSEALAKESASSSPARPMHALIASLTEKPLTRDLPTVGAGRSRAPRVASTKSQTYRSSRAAREQQKIISDALKYAARLKLAALATATMKFMRIEDIRVEYRLQRKQMERVRKALDNWRHHNEDEVRVDDPTGGKVRYAYPAHVVAQIVNTLLGHVSA